MKSKSYKGVRITREGSRFFATHENLGQVQITPANALDIFMSCTSFCGDIQNELFIVGSCGRHTLLYPAHHSYYKETQQEKKASDSFEEEYKNLKFGDVVMFVHNKEPLKFCGNLNYQKLEETEFYRNIHARHQEARNSTKAKMFMSSSGKIYFAPMKGSSMKGKISLKCSERIDPFINLLDSDGVLEVAQTYCSEGLDKFVEIIQNKKIEVVFVHSKRFKAEDLGWTKVLQPLTMDELASKELCNRSRHYLKIGDDFMTLSSVSVQTGKLFFGMNGISVEESLKKEKPLLLQFYLK